MHDVCQHHLYVVLLPPCVDINRLSSVAAAGTLGQPATAATAASLQSPTRAAAGATDLQQTMADSMWLANMTAAATYGTQNST